MLKENYKNTDSTYLYQGMEIFFKLRDETQNKLDNFVKKLVREALPYSDQFNKVIDQSDKLIKEHKDPLNIINKLIGKVNFLYCNIKMFPKYFKQARKLKALGNVDTKYLGIVLALASNRLQVKGKDLNLREHISSLTKEFTPGMSGLGVEQEIKEANNLFICDPLFKSPLWARSEECWESGIYILDSQFLMFQAALAMMRLRYLSYLKGMMSWRLLGGRKRAFAAILFKLGYHESLLYPARIKAYFLTSNSFSTEILRLHLIQSAGCDSLCEIMHGVPTIFYEQYIAGILRAGEVHGYNAFEKHSSISQIPMLPMFGVLQEDVKCGMKHAINPYLNQYVLDRQLDKQSISGLLTQECNVIFKNRVLCENTIIITFIGAMSLDVNHFESDIFKIECCMIKHIKKTLDNLNKPYVFLYAPHPGHHFNSFLQCNFFNENNIIIYRDTIFTWFISDISLALFSGALFEAAYFGCHSFMPTIEDDELYPEVLLNLLHHPSGEFKHNYIQALDQLLIKFKRTDCLDLVSRGEKRIQLFINERLYESGDEIDVASSL